MSTDTLYAGNNGRVAGTDSCSSTSNSGGTCAPISYCGDPVLVQQGHYWDDFSSGAHQSWWTSTGTLSCVYAITSGGNGTPATDIVELQYSLNNGSSWSSFSGFPKTVTSASGTATKTGITSGQNLANVQIRAISKAASCSPCDPGNCNYAGVYVTISNVKLVASYTEPTGACCNGSSCSIATDAACSGTWYGAGTTCSPDPCGDPVGRCCVDVDDCRIRSETDCTGLGGTYGGDGTNCTGDPCGSAEPTGSCCTGSVCSVTTEGGCGGTWTEDGTCSPSPCALSPIALLVG